MVGPAVTVQLANLDILACAAATKVVQPGDVVVIAAQGRTELSVWGAGLTRAVAQAGGVGVIVDGVVESTGVIRDLGTPVFARGVFPRAGTVEKAGSVKVPVAVAGVVINPGDLIIGNADAIYVMPREWAPLLIEQLEKATAGLRASQTRARPSSMPATASSG